LEAINGVVVGKKLSLRRFAFTLPHRFETGARILLFECLKKIVSVLLNKTLPRISQADALQS